MSSGAPDIPTRANMSNSSKDQPLVYHNPPPSLSSIAQNRLVRSGDPDQPYVYYQSFPQSISSMAQDRILRSDVTGDSGGQNVEGTPGFEAAGAPKNPSLIDDWGANTSDNNAAALTLSQIRPAVRSQENYQASIRNNEINYAGKSLSRRTGKNVTIEIEYA
ncbi:hypothetical protein Tco_0540305 [Tanacetum coccineum]